MEGDGAGDEVLSFNRDGTVESVEVKTTRGPAETALFMSTHELAFARQLREHYWLYRIYRNNAEAHSVRCDILTGHPEHVFTITPTHDRLSPR
jgi:Domain of unknown function (DUF3883)